MPSQNCPHERTKNHIYAGQRGWIRTNVKIMELLIGRPLKPDEVVHHLDGNPRNNRIRNLRLMPKRDHDRLNSVSRHRDFRGRFLPEMEVGCG